MAKTRSFDTAEYIDSPEAIAEYLTEAFLTHDPEVITKAIGTAARARGMSNIAKDAGLNRENLYKSLGGSDVRTEFGTVMKVLSALNIELTAHAKVA